MGTMMKYKQIADKYLLRVKETVFDRGAAARLPAEYRKFWKEWRETVPEPVHYIPQKGNWKKLETGEMKRIENVPIPGFYTKEFHDHVISGGERIIQGFKQKHSKARRNPHFWMPVTIKSVIYSEVLDKHISVLITKRAVDLILKHQGFDTYVLKTRACDLGTLLAIKLKRKILLALRDKTLPYDEEKNEMIMEKYRNLMLPPEEIEWYGLTVLEAILKLEEMEDEEEERKIIPLKHIYRRDLIRYLESKKNNSEFF